VYTDVRNRTPQDKLKLKKTAFERYLGKSEQYSVGFLPPLAKAGYAQAERGINSYRQYRKHDSKELVQEPDTFWHIDESIAKSLNLGWMNFYSDSGVNTNDMEMWKEQKKRFDAAPANVHRKLIKQAIINTLASKCGESFSTNFDLHEYISEKGAIFAVSGIMYTFSGNYFDSESGGMPGFGNKNSYALIISTSKTTDNDATAAANFINRLGGNAFISLIEQNPQKNPGMHAKEKIAGLSFDLADATGKLSEATKTIGLLEETVGLLEERLQTRENEAKNIAEQVKRLTDKAKANEQTIIRLQINAAAQDKALDEVCDARDGYLNDYKTEKERTGIQWKALNKVKEEIENAGIGSRGSAIKKALETIEAALKNKP